MFLNTYHREHILLKLKIKKLLRKIVSKNLSAVVRDAYPGRMHSLTPYMFYRNPPSWNEGKIESPYRSGSTVKTIVLWMRTTTNRL